MNEKRCKTCGIIKPFADFYSHRLMADGFLNKCKTCTRASTSKYHKANREKAVRWASAYRKRHPQIAAEINARWNAKAANKAQRSVNWTAWAAVRRGDIKRAFTCELCGISGKRLTMHHRDYNKPLEITWLCAKCHWLEDERRRSIRRGE